MVQASQAHAQQLIERGLAKRARGPLPSPAGIGDLLDFNKLDTYGILAANRATRLNDLLDGLAAQFAKFDAEEIPRRAQELKGLPLSAGQRAEQLRRAKAAERARLLGIEALATERANLLAQLRDQRIRAVTARALWSNPISVLVRLFANTKEAAAWREASRTWGVLQTRDMIDTARANQDSALLVVCFERLDTMSPDDRKAVERSKADVVKEMPCAKVAERCVIVCDAIAYLHDHADLKRCEVEGLPFSSGEKLELAARGKALEPFFAEPESTAAE